MMTTTTMGKTRKTQKADLETRTKKQTRVTKSLLTGRLCNVEGGGLTKGGGTLEEILTVTAISIETMSRGGVVEGLRGVVDEALPEVVAVASRERVDGTSPGVVHGASRERVVVVDVAFQERAAVAAAALRGKAALTRRVEVLFRGSKGIEVGGRVILVKGATLAEGVAVEHHRIVPGTTGWPSRREIIAVLIGEVQVVATKHQVCIPRGQPSSSSRQSKAT